MMKWVFGADTAPFRKGLDEMRTQTKAFAGSIKGMIAGAIGVTAIVSGFKTLIDQMGRIDDLAKRFGESAESIQKVGLAAKLAGSDLEGVAKAMTVVTKNANTAATQGGSMAESFAALGIDAGSFVNLPIEEKILALAKSMENGKGSGENLAMMMAVLGKSGAEMIPLLSQGFEELQTQMEETEVVSGSSVEAMAKAGDSIDAMSQKATVAGAAIFDVLRFIVGAVSINIASTVKTFMDGFSLIVHSAKSVGTVLEGVFTADLDKIKSGSKRFVEGQKEFAKDLRDNFQSVKEGYSEMKDEIYGDKGETEKKPPVDVESIEEAIKAEEERKKLIEQIAKLKEEAAMSELSMTEKILELEKRRSELAAKVGDDVEGLTAQKELLENEKELKKLREDQEKESADFHKKEQDAADKLAEKEKQKAEKLAALQKEEEKQIRDIKFEGATDEEKVTMLKKEQTELLKKSEAAGKAGNKEDEISLRMEAREKGSQITDILNDKKDTVLPTLSTSSLASIGGGGSANILAAGTQKIDRQISLLEVIARNTARTETGGSKIPDPI